MMRLAQDYQDGGSDVTWATTAQTGAERVGA